MNTFLSRMNWRLTLPLVLLLTFFLLRRDFLSVGNLYALMQAFALLGIATLGISMTMIAGEFDLSVGAVAAVTGLVLVKTGDTRCDPICAHEPELTSKARSLHDQFENDCCDNEQEPLVR